MPLISLLKILRLLLDKNNWKQEENKKQLLIPRGFGHGFVTLTDDVEFLYKADNYYAPEADAGIRWNDPEIGIEWGVENPILSDKDKQNPFLKDAEIFE